MNAKYILKKSGNFAFLLSGAFLIASVVMSIFPLQQVSGADKVNICHWTGAGKYVSITVDVSSVNKWITQGHGDHPNDIWADFTTDDGHFVAGQGDTSILNNGCELPAAPTDTTVPPTATYTAVPPTPTYTAVPPTPTYTTVPPTSTYTTVPLILTDTPVPLSMVTPVPPTPTWTLLPFPTYTPVPPTSILFPVTVFPPASGGSNVILPVTGVDQGTFSRELPGAFANMCLGFLGLGLVLHGIARR